MPSDRAHPPSDELPRLKRRLRPKRRRVALQLAYQGGGFRGFQRQPEQRTVEGVLVEALVGLGLTGGLGFASRTDAGVHAEGQVVAVPISAADEPHLFAERLQALLPPDVQVRACAWAPASFHPRWSAHGKRYVYRLAPDAGAIPDERAWRLEVPRLDPAPFDSAAEGLRRAPDLGGFTAAGVDAKEAPALTGLRVERDGAALKLVFEGPAFRRYAIRHMVGALVEEALGRTAPGTTALLAAALPPYRGLRAPAGGLVLEEVRYPAPLDPFHR